MKKTMKALLVSSMMIGSAHADFLMTLTDKDGIETSQCVKSYSFSNNLESLHKEQNQIKDVYSYEEALTNKTWLGKPIYRKVLKHKVLSGAHTVNINDFNNLDVENARMTEFYLDRDTDGWFSSALSFGGQNPVNWNLTFDINKDGSQLYNNVSSNVSWAINQYVYIVVEYSKTTDTAQTENETVTTLVHYLPSNTTTGEYVTKIMDDMGVRFKKDYTYDSDTDSCIKN